MSESAEFKTWGLHELTLDVVSLESLKERRNAHRE
jgi:hypothetical protein